MFTILTPTYNRSQTLKRLFKSLQVQTFKKFDWLIIDDGSIDDTNKIILEIKKNADFNIHYIYKENGGKHTALIESKKYLKNPYVIVVDSDDEILPNCLDIFHKHIMLNSNLVEIRGRCVNSRLELLGKYKFPNGNNYLDMTYHQMVLKNNNDDELLSCFKLDYFLNAVKLPDKILFEGKFKYFGEAYFWSRIKGVVIRFIDEPLRIYNDDSGNSIMNNTLNITGYYNDIVGFKYFLDENHRYFLWRPKYFISQYIKLSVASIIVGHGFLRSHLLYDRIVNRFISSVLSPVSLVVYFKMKYLDKKFWR